MVLSYLRKRAKLWYCLLVTMASVMCNSMYKKGELPGAPLTNFNDEDGGGGDPREVYILYPKKSQLDRICLPIKINTFFSIPQKIP